MCWSRLFLPLLVLVLMLGLSEPLWGADLVELQVVGVEDEARQNVKEALVLPQGLVRNGRVDVLWLERFARQSPEKVKGALEPFGYYNAKVDARLVPTGSGRYRLEVRIDRGQPVRIGALTVAVTGAGAKEEKLQDLVDTFPLEKGDVLLQQPYEQAKGALKSTAEELGYLDAEFPAHEIRINAARTEARIDLVMDTGSRYLFDGATIEGAPDYPDPFLRRYLSFKSGDVFSYSRLGQTQLNFSNSERFKEVIVTPHKDEASDHAIPVSIQLKQIPRRLLRPGLGYGTDTGARFSLRYRDLNMLQRGHEYNANLFISQRLQGFANGYIIPSADDIRSSTSLQLNLQREITTYTSRLVALELDKNLSFGRGELGTAYLRLQRESFTIGAEDSRSRLVLPGIRYTRDHFRDLVRPQKGFRYSFDVRGTHQVIGSDVGLIQFIAEGSDLTPLPWRLSLHSRARAGLTALNDPMADLPASLRFFAGGDQSVRGYSYKSLGPRDATGAVVGGRNLLVASMELERALFKDWGVSVFYDTGNAFNDFAAIKLYSGAGVGLHYYTRVGALNLSVARQLGVDNPAFHIHFTVGVEL